MPRYRVRLEAQDSDEFRVTYLTTETPEKARAWCEDRERAFVAVSLSDEELKTASKANRLLHEQAKPYKVVSVVERGKQTSKTKAKRRKAG